MKLANFRKHVSQKLLLISDSNLVDTYITKGGASNNYVLMSMTSFPLQRFAGIGLSLWLNYLGGFFFCFFLLLFLFLIFFLSADARQVLRDLNSSD